MFRSRTTALTAVLAGFAIGGCLNFDPFACAEDTECVLDGDAGVCQLSGFCSYIDPACITTGLRYAEDAGDGLAGECVEPMVATGSTMPVTTDPTIDPDGSTGGSGTTTSTTMGPTTASTETDPQTDTSTGDNCGSSGEVCCEGDMCDAGLGCYAGRCSCVASVTSGADHTCLTTEDGELWCWGDNTFGQLGSALAGPFSDVPVLVDAPFAVDGTAAVFTAANRQTCAVGSDGSASCWGANELLQSSTSNVSPTVLPSPLVFGAGFQQIAAGDSFTCTLSGPDDMPTSTSCFGSNLQQQLGTIEDVNGPNTFEFGNTVLQLGAGDNFACGRVISGQIFCWGSNSDGQLAADPGTLPMSAPLRQVSTNPASDLAVGRRYACAVVDDTVMCWGRNDVGQLGDGTGLQQIAPVPVVLPIGTVADLTAGPSHTCALMATGELYCWGSNAGGQLQLVPDAMGFDGFSLTPALVDVGGLEIEAVVGGTEHACILTTTHDVHCWSPNTAGQAGSGAPRYVFTPQPIAFSCQ